MRNLDDEQFEAYLKAFHPVSPDSGPTMRTRKNFLRSMPLLAWIAASAAILMIAASFLRTTTRAIADRHIGAVASLKLQPPLAPLTIGTANSWLVNTPSIDAALDDLVFVIKENPIPANKQSAIAALSEEKTKP